MIKILKNKNLKKLNLFNKRKNKMTVGLLSVTKILKKDEKSEYFN